MITYKIVGSDHEICGHTCPASLPRRMHNFWKSRCLGSSHGAVIAYDGKKVIGFFRWDKSWKYMYGYGTYVLGKYRRQGVAVKLWKRALKKIKPRQVYVVITSYSGEALAFALKKKFPKHKWHIEENYQ
jgi:GNAT superfamily N-acetyltransferase